MMTSSDPKPKSEPAVGDGDDEDEREYEEIEVEEVDDDDGGDDDDEYEEIEIEEEVEVDDDGEEEEDPEYEEVEEEVEDVKLEEVAERGDVSKVEDGLEVIEELVEEDDDVGEDDDDVEVIEEIVYEEVDEDDVSENDDDDVSEDDGDDSDEEEEEESGDEPEIEAKVDSKNDASSCMEFSGDDMHSSRHSVAVECDTNVSPDTLPVDVTMQGNTVVKSEENIPSDIQASETIGLGDSSTKSDEQNREGKETSLVDGGTPNIPELMEHRVGVLSHSCSGVKDEPGSAENSIPADVSVKQCSAPYSSDAEMSENTATDILAAATMAVVQSMEGKLKTSRSLQVRPRSPFQGERYEDGNKRPAVICEYFAKGWCIKGSLCRFLHKRDHVDGHSQKGQGAILASNTKHQLGSGDVAVRSNSSAAFNDTQLKHVEMDETVLYEKEVASFKDKSNSILGSKEVEGDILKEIYALDRHNYREATVPGSRDGSHSKCRSPLYSNMDKTASIRSHYPLISSKSSFVPYNWEPSAPFQPSYSIPCKIKRFSDVQYDPLRDSIEQADDPSEFSNHRGSKFEDVQSISGQISLEIGKNLHRDIWDKNYYGCSKDGVTFTSDVKNKNIFEEENHMVKAVINTADVDCNSQSDKIGDIKVIVTEKEEKSGYEESKVIRFFRAALVEFVKELMRPIWHEGRLSKDVYKVIVQKSEEKVFSTLTSDKVPSTSESIKQYLSLSRPKILKLIQAYVDKYGEKQ